MVLYEEVFYCDHFENCVLVQGTRPRKIAIFGSNPHEYRELVKCQKLKDIKAF